MSQIYNNDANSAVNAYFENPSAIFDQVKPTACTQGYLSLLLRSKAKLGVTSNEAK